MQGDLGGGEIYTRFLTQALTRLGWDTVLIVSRQARFWNGFMPEGVQYRQAHDPRSLLAALPAAGELIITHSALPEEMAPDVAARNPLCGFLRMPLYERPARGFRHYRKLFAVSRHVRDSAIASGLDRKSTRLNSSHT